MAGQYSGAGRIRTIRPLSGACHPSPRRSGRPWVRNPADLLGSQRTDEIIAKLTDMAEIVLFDAPPVIAVTDATILGSKVDGVLLVISAGKTRRDQAERAKESLEKANVRIIGAALTNAPKDSSIGAYYG